VDLVIQNGADRPHFGPVSSASHATHIRIHDVATRLHLTVIKRQDSMAAKGVDMSTSVTVADWIKRIADDERRRDTLRVKEDEMVARKADLVRRNGRRLIDELRATVTRDVEAFRGEFAGDRARDIVVEATASDGGFVVRKPAPAAVSLTVTPSLETAAMVCRYRFTLTNGLPPREDRIDVMFAGDGGETLQMKHHGTGQVFTTAEALSELLLVPVLTGRPR
jgi:hypothetical protein